MVQDVCRVGSCLIWGGLGGGGLYRVAWCLSNRCSLGFTEAWFMVSLEVAWGLFGVGLRITCDWFQADFGFANDVFKLRLGFM